MKFLAIKIPKNNEYSAVQAYAMFSGLFLKPKPKGIAGLFSKGSNVFYSLNIICINQNIQFVVGTTDDMVDYLKNQVYAQYSKADITEFSFIDIYQKVNFDLMEKYELVFNDSPLVPIKTYEDTQELDPIASLLSAMSRSSDPNAFYWLQIIAQPAENSWQSKALSKITKLSSAEFVSQTTQNRIAQIQLKLKHNAYYANMRIITDNPVNANAILNGLSILYKPGGNTFKIKKPNFLQQKNFDLAVYNHTPYGTACLLNIAELATIWHLPNGTIDIPNIVWGKKIQLEPPEDLPIALLEMSDEKKRDITFIGKTVYKNRSAIFGFNAKDRLRHFYVVGKTGTGKSVLLVNMAIEDIRKGHGIAFLDPHGDAIEIILKYIPKNRINDVCFFNPSDPEYSYPLNILEVQNESQKELMVSGIIAIFYKLYSYSWGPRLEHILRNVLFTLIHVPNATLPDIMKILHDNKYRENVLQNINDPLIHQFWRKEYDAMTDKFRDEAIAPILNKVGQFVTSPLMRRIIQHPKSKVKISEIMDNKKIFLCDLSQGKIGEDNSALLGSMLITQIQVAAMNRAFQKEEDRVPFYLYVDEFQNFATNSFGKILSEARKYKLGLTLANQYITQIDEAVMGAILGNVGSIACYNVGAKDAEILYREFGATITPDDLSNGLDKFQMIMRMMIGQTMSPAFTFYTLPLPKNVSGHELKIIEQSRKQFGVASKK